MENERSNGGTNYEELNAESIVHAVIGVLVSHMDEVNGVGGGGEE